MDARQGFRTRVPERSRRPPHLYTVVFVRGFNFQLYMTSIVEDTYCPSQFVDHFAKWFGSNKPDQSLPRRSSGVDKVI